MGGRRWADTISCLAANLLRFFSPETCKAGILVLAIDASSIPLSVFIRTLNTFLAVSANQSEVTERPAGTVKGFLEKRRPSEQAVKQQGV